MSMFDPFAVNLEQGFLEAEDRAVLQKYSDVWILGCRFQSKDFELISRDVYSRVWMTYRKNFAPIGCTGPTSDQGWGCMLRCGQMVLAQTLINRHLGRDWRLDPSVNQDAYHRILRMFQDKKDCCYSIHQIAKMGETEGKAIGEWFGPSTIAHVIKKLAVHDDWTSLVVHVAMDNIVFLDDVKRLCLNDASAATDCGLRSSSVEGDAIYNGVDERSAGCCSGSSEPKQNWRPLLLLLPLRLGLTQLNPCYIPAVKEFFACENSLGMVGGRPNHALYFIGNFGQHLLYLDPHICQSFVDLDVRDEEFDDSSYHTASILHMPITEIDPSIALAFYFASESEFDTFTSTVASKQSLFEVMHSRPANWPPLVPLEEGDRTKPSEFLMLDHQDSDDDFEMLN